MKVWIFIDSADSCGKDAVKGIYETEEKAKLAIADYVLKNETDTHYLELFEMEVKWLKFIGKQIKIEPPKNPKKITGTRFASVLGLDKWNTDFKTWCARL